MDVYFHDLMARKGIALMEEVRKIIAPFRKNASEIAKERQVRAFHDQAADPRRSLAKRPAKLKTDALEGLT